MLEQHDDVWELTVVTLDKPFLFSNISGVLSYFGMDIHRGQAMTTPDGLVLDVFEFSDEEGFLRQNADAPTRSRGCSRTSSPDASTCRRCCAAASTACSIAAAGAARRWSTSTTSTRRKYTVLEIVADDAPGLLYRISRVDLRPGLRRGSGADLDRRQEGHRRAARDEAGRKLDEADQAALRAGLERMLEDTYEAD